MSSRTPASEYMFSQVEARGIEPHLSLYAVHAHARYAQNPAISTPSSPRRVCTACTGVHAVPDTYRTPGRAPARTRAAAGVLATDVARPAAALVLVLVRECVSRAGLKGRAAPGVPQGCPVSVRHPPGPGRGPAMPGGDRSGGVARGARMTPLTHAWHRRHRHFRITPFARARKRLTGNPCAGCATLCQSLGCNAAICCYDNRVAAPKVAA